MKMSSIMGHRKQRTESGRVRVYVRVRPLARDDLVGVNEREKENGYEVRPEYNQIKIFATKLAKDKYYKFDKVFPGGATNNEVFCAIGRPFVHAAVNGFNGTLFAYGQTGSGKTYSLMAPDGLLASVVNRLFSRITEDKAHSYKVICAYMQIYQEKVYDLLNSNPNLDLFIREDPKLGIYVENLSQYVCHSPLDVFELVRIGRKRLIFAETRMNRQSSRSHSVCQLTIERTKAKDVDTGKETRNRSSVPRRPTSCISPVSSISEIVTSEELPNDVGLMRRRASSRKSVGSDIQASSARSVGLRGKSISSGNLSLSKRQSQIPVSQELTTQKRRSAIITGSSSGLRSIVGKDSQDLFWADGVTPSIERHRPSSAASLISDACSETDSMMDEFELNMLNMSTPDFSQVKTDSFDETQDDYAVDGEDYNDVLVDDGDVVLRGKINICDLAGSERIKKTHAEGDRLSEAQHINLSLLELGNVVAALAEGNRSHIPYRNSALTRLLQDSLGGNCKTSFLLCVSPNMRDLNETKCTLDFGQRALKVSTTPRMNVEVDYKRLAEELERKLVAKETECRTLSENFERALATLKQQLDEENQRKIDEMKMLHEQEVSILKNRLGDLEKELNLEKEQSANKEASKAHSILVTELMSLLLLSQLSELKGQIAEDEINRNDLPSADYALIRDQSNERQPRIAGNSEEHLEDESFSSGYDSGSRPSQGSSIDEREIRNEQQCAQQGALKQKRPVSVCSESSFAGSARPCSPLLEKIRSPYMSRKNSLLEELLVENQLRISQGESFLKTVTARERIDALRRDVTRTSQTITNELRSFIGVQFLKDDISGLESLPKKELYKHFAHHLIDSGKQYPVEPLDHALNLVSVDHILTGCLLALDERKQVEYVVKGTSASAADIREDDEKAEMEPVEELYSDGRDHEPDGESKHSENICPIARVDTDLEEESDVIYDKQPKLVKKKNRLSRFFCMPLRSSRRQRNKYISEPSCD